MKRILFSVLIAISLLAAAPAARAQAAPDPVVAPVAAPSTTVVVLPAASQFVMQPTFFATVMANKGFLEQCLLWLLIFLGPTIIVGCNNHPNSATNALKKAILMVLARFSIAQPSNAEGTFKFPIVGPGDVVTPVASKPAPSVLYPTLLALLCLPQASCVTGWTAAEKAAPACYGLNASSLSTLVSEGKTIATTTASGCATGVATCVTAVENDVGTYLANKALDDQAFQCVVEAIKLEVAYPNGGEPAYVPDAGSPDAGAVVADARLPLERAVALSSTQITALEALSNLAAQHHAAAHGGK